MVVPGGEIRWVSKGGRSKVAVSESVVEGSSTDTVDLKKDPRVGGIYRAPLVRSGDAPALVSARNMVRVA